MADSNISGSPSTIAADGSFSTSQMTNEDVYEFYKKHKDSGDSKGIVDKFLNHFGAETAASYLTVYNKIKSVYDTYPESEINLEEK